MPSRIILSALVLVLAFPGWVSAYQLEHLNRGLVAVPTGSNEVFLSWRLQGMEPSGTQFNVYRATNGGGLVLLNAVPLTGATTYVDAGVDLAQDNVYRVRAIHDGVAQRLSEPFLVPAGAPIQQYLRVPIDKPGDVTDPLAGSYSYSANDCSVGDLDGDGDYEIVLKWNPSNAKDNSQSGHTGNVYLDAYDLDGDGTPLWRIDLGINVRAGAHYTQFIVYDLNGDGKAEVACRTAPGAKDAADNYVGGLSNWQDTGVAGAWSSFSDTADYRNGSGYILQGPEFLTIFNGETGEELVSTNFIPFRDPDFNDHSPSRSRLNTVWGDSYGNRIDRFLAGVGYFGPGNPSLLMTRGYYTRTFLVAWDWDGTNLSQRWVFDSDDPGHGDYAGQGAHSLSIGDVDSDGFDEIIFGGCTIDHDGTGLYSTKLGTGDALHMSDMDPARPGLEVWMVHESPSTYGDSASELHDAATGEIIFHEASTDDVGRGAAGDVDPRTVGFEAWSSRAYIHDIQGNQIVAARPGPMNFLCWWDGDLLRELLDGTTISKWDWLTDSTNSVLAPAGVSSNNGTKATPCLSADLFGDWREEVVWRESDDTALRIYTTTIPTTHRLPTLMHDRQYRLAIAWQNVGYNQPPHPGYYLGDGMAPAPTPVFTTVPPPDAPPPVGEEFPDFLTSLGLDPETTGPNDPFNGSGSSLYEAYVFDLPNQHPLEVGVQSGEVILDVATPRDEIDYRLDGATNPGDWSEIVTIASTGGRTEVAFPLAVAREYYRVVAVSSYPFTPGPVTTVYQAEDASFNGSADSNHAGFNGTGFVNSPSTGFIEWTGVDGGAGGPATLTFRFALGTGSARTGSLVVNGVSQSITFDPTGAWDSWTTIEVLVPLNAGGGNVIRLETVSDGDLANIDELSVAAPAGGGGDPEPAVALNLPILDPYETGDIFIIGDSTVANYNGSYYPWKGWGQEFQKFVDPARFTVHNRARGGRSSKSFIVEGLWDGVKAELSYGDYLLIQWGHNDRDFTKPERYTTEPEYKGYLTQYINEARALGAVPIFVTPMVMNAWSGSTMRNVFTESGNNYAGWMKEVATTLDVPVIDLNQKSYDHFSVLDYDTNGRYYYNTYVAGEYPNYPSGNTDGTHFQEMGALLMGKFVAESFREIDPDPRVSALENGLKPQYPFALKANLPAAGRISLDTELPEGATFTLKALEESGHTFIHWADSAGSVYTTDNLTTLTVAPQGYQFTAYFDSTTPVTPPAPGATIPGGDPFDYAITLSATATDPVDDVVLVELFNDDTDKKIGEATAPPFEIYWEADSGVYNLRAESVSDTGTRTVSPVMVLNTEAANTTPTATLTAPSDGSLFDAGDDVSLTATASDPDGIVTKVQFFVDGTFLGEDDTAPYEAAWNNIPGGVHALSAVAIDDRGAESTASVANVTVDFGTVGALLQEAEAGTLVGSFTVVSDGAASGGQAVEAVSGPADTNYVEFEFDVPTAGDYVLRGRIKAIDGNHDSMFVSVDGAAADQYLWDTARSTSFVDDYVFDRGGSDPLVLTLTAGTHTIRFGYRENLFLDQVELEAWP